MRGEHIREVLETVLPEEALMKLAVERGFQTRQRKLDATRLLRAMIISASTPNGGRQAAVARAYFKSGCKKVVRGGFYRWFNKALEACMEECRDRALEYARRQKKDLPGVLGRHVSDWHIVDSMTVKLKDDLKEEYPGTGDYAALKVHKFFSVGAGTTIGYHLNPAREHDAMHLEIDESWSGLGLLADLGYASFSLLRACENHDVRYVIRLKDNWKPKVDRVISGTTIMGFGKGTDLDLLLECGVIRLNGKAIDADVRVGDDIACRLVAVKSPKGYYCFYLTNLPRTAGPRQVADLYRVRWEIEKDNKLDKSCHQLDRIDAKKPEVVRALVHASIIASMMVCLIAHHHRIEETKPPRQGADRKVPPVHPQMLALAMGSAYNELAAALELRGKEADKAWDFLAGILMHMGTDPNWRRRPSVLDQFRGWKVQPGKPRNARKKRAAEAN